MEAFYFNEKGGANLLGKGGRRVSEHLWGYFFIGPQIIGLLLFVLGPVAFAFTISFMEWDITSTPRWLGLDNYAKRLSDPVFWHALRNTFVYTALHVPLTMIAALAIALLLNGKIPGRALFRAAFFVPVVTSSVAVALVWQWLYNADYGVINLALSHLNIQGPAWLQDTSWALPSIVLMSVWQGVGYNMVLFLAALQGVPRHLYESAEIDGANRWQRFRSITLPMISPTTFFVMVMSIIGAMQIFNEPYVMTRGGPADATNVIVLEIYKTAFKFYRMGEASSLAFVLFFMILLVTLAQFKLSKWVNYDV